MHYDTCLFGPRKPIMEKKWQKHRKTNQNGWPQIFLCLSALPGIFFCLFVYGQTNWKQRYWKVHNFSKMSFPRFQQQLQHCSYSLSCLWVGWGTLLFVNAHIKPWNSFQITINSLNTALWTCFVSWQRIEVNPIQQTHIQNSLHYTF